MSVKQSLLIRNAKIVSGDLNHVIITAMNKEMEEAISVMKHEFKKFDYNEYNGTIFIDSYKMGHGLLKAISLVDAFLLFPIVAVNGVENFRIISKERSALDRISEIVSTNNNIEHNRIERIAVSTAMSYNLYDNSVPSIYGLTSREIETLKVALNAGYYEWPRKNNLGSVSNGNGVSKVTTLYHLRKAEKKIMEGLFRKQQN